MSGLRGSLLGKYPRISLQSRKGDDCAAEAAKSEDGGMNRPGLSDGLGLLAGDFGLMMMGSLFWSGGAWMFILGFMYALLRITTYIPEGCTYRCTIELFPKS